MNRFRAIVILATLCFMETGLVVGFPKQNIANKVASVPFILIFGYLIFQIIKSFDTRKKVPKKAGHNFLNLDKKDMPKNK